MTVRAKRWLWTISGLAFILVVGLFAAAHYLSRKFEPYIRSQTIDYLKERFDSEVEISSLRVSMPMKSPVGVLLAKGKGAVAHVEGEGIVLRHKGRRDIPPIFVMRKFNFDLDVASILERPIRVLRVKLEGMEITVPPKGERPRLTKKKVEPDQPVPDPRPERGKKPSVIIDLINADGTKLSMLPRDPTKAPLEFVIYKLTLHSAGPRVAMRYNAALTNPKPPGIIDSQGSFGPWVADDPSETPLDGVYTFERADLGVFKGIDGQLSASGKFVGVLDYITVDGEARVPKFRLKKVGNPVPLSVEYHCIVDGTNGNTLLQPVQATLGQSRFELRGGVVRAKDVKGRTVQLDVRFIEGHIEDMLRLAAKGDPILRGPVDLKVKFHLPPGKAEIADRLRLDGTFALQGAHFTSHKIQDKIDELSQRGQGKPKDISIDEVPSDLVGEYKLADGVIDFAALKFVVPGAEVALSGRYMFDKDALDFRGKLRLDAKVSQTQTGWKRWVLKPVDPFFSKEGAGTLLPIKVTGTADNPAFGLDRDKKKSASGTAARSR